MQISATIDATTDRSGTGRVHWGTADAPLAERSASAGGPGVPHPFGEPLRYDALTRAFVRATSMGMSALVDRMLIVKPS